MSEERRPPTTVRFTDENHEFLQQREVETDRSVNFLVNKAVEALRYQIPSPRVGENNPDTGLRCGLSTYMMSFEFQVSDLPDPDTHVHNMVDWIRNWISQQGGVISNYPRVDRLAGMHYDKRFGFLNPAFYAEDQHEEDKDLPAPLSSPVS